MPAPAPGAGLLDSFIGPGELFARVDSVGKGGGIMRRSVKSFRTVIKRTEIK